jgi:hypothetical protein
MDCMGNEQKKLGRGGALAVATVAVVALAMLYLLSIGPAFWLLGHGYIPEWPLRYFYAPVGWASRWCDPFKDFMTWYVHLWWSV